MGLFDKWLGKESAPKTSDQAAESPEQIHMACAALMLEVAEADYVDEPEETAILEALEAEFGLTHRTVTDLLERARKESAGASDMFHTTY